jgi:hypothetical protein
MSVHGDMRGSKTAALAFRDEKKLRMQFSGGDL